MCKYCENKEKVAEFIDQRVIYVDKNELNVTTKDGNITYSVKVNYCPMCGRKLNK